MCAFTVLILSIALHLLPTCVCVAPLRLLRGSGLLSGLGGPLHGEGFHWGGGGGSGRIGGEIQGWWGLAGVHTVEDPSSLWTLAGFSNTV